MIELISRDSAIRAMDELEEEDINIYGCKIPEGFDGERARLAICLLPTVEVLKLTRENIEVMLSIAYRSGWKDGRGGKDLPTLKELDEMVKGIYDRTTEKPIGSLKETGAQKENDGDYPEVLDNQYDNMTGTMNL